MLNRPYLPLLSEHIVAQGASLEFVTPDRMLGFEIGGTNYPVYYKIFLDAGVVTTLTRRLTGIVRDNAKLVVTLDNEFNGALESRVVVFVHKAARLAEHVSHEAVLANQLFFRFFVRVGVPYASDQRQRAHQHQ